MQMISLILSGLALLTAIVSLALAAREKKRGEKRNTAFAQYMGSADKTMKEHEKQISELKNGAVPDYEQARAAANAVNDFNRGISNILGFDPFDALKKERSREGAGGEVE